MKSHNTAKWHKLIQPDSFLRFVMNIGLLFVAIQTTFPEIKSGWKHVNRK